MAALEPRHGLVPMPATSARFRACTAAGAPKRPIRLHAPMVDVRPAAAGDLPVLAEFSCALGIESEGRSADPATVQASIEAALRDPGKARYFVAEAEGTVVGSLFVTSEWSDWTNGWYWWIQGAYVLPDRRGQGVFQALYDAVHAAAGVAGDVRRIRLYVEKDNEAALATYRALGMHEEPYRVFDAAVRGGPSRAEGP